MKSSVVAFSLLGVPLCGHTQVAEEAPLVWQSRNNTFNELTKEFADLYGNLNTLQTQGLAISTASVTVPAGKTVAETLRIRNLFDGQYFPKQLDVLVCRLNPENCTVSVGKSRKITADDASTAWTLPANQAINVPNIEFIPLNVHKPYLKKSGESWKSIVVDQRRGCEVFDEACVKYVQNLNRRLPVPLDNAYRGKVVVPTKAYRAAIHVSHAANSSGVAPTFRSFKSSSGTIDTDSTKYAMPPVVVQWNEPPSNLVKAVPTLADRLIPPSKAIPHDSASGGASVGSRSLVLKLINHPLSRSQSLVLPLTAKANVAVFDLWVDQAHCMLSSMTVIDPDRLGGAVDRASACGELGSTAESTDHGTHVVGLIGTRLDAAQGPGTNPFASISAISVNFDNFVHPLYLATQADRLRDLYKTTPPNVVNLSFEYSLSEANGRNDVFHAAMKDQEDTLFVVSAGNSGAFLSQMSECHVRPACYDDKNIVTVGGLNLSEDTPERWVGATGGSNFGDRVHLAAPAVNILSTISGDRTGVMTGTSQAAPIVSGAASLLYLYDHLLRPSQVKNRLIYSSDLYPALYDNFQGGRLNVERLLSYKTALVDTLVDISGERHIRGVIREPNKLVRFVDYKKDQAFSLSFVQIRRLMFNPSLGYYTLFYNDEIGRDTGLLNRRFVTLKDAKATIAIGVATRLGEPDRKVNVRLGDIADYVSPLLL